MVAFWALGARVLGLLSKIFLTLLVAVVALFGKRLIASMMRPSPPRSGGRQPGELIDLEQCPVCDEYVDRKARRACSRPDCPMK